jgi:hypothetical protein
LVELIATSLVNTTVAESTLVDTAGLTVSMNVLRDVTELLSVTVTVSTVAVQVSVGVPEIKPVPELIDKPAGKDVTE